MNIRFASSRVKSYYNMAALALRTQKYFTPSVFSVLSPELRKCKAFALLEVRAPQATLDEFSDELLDDDDIAEQVIANDSVRWEFSKMSDRVKRKYLHRLPEPMRTHMIEELEKK